MANEDNRKPINPELEEALKQRSQQRLYADLLGSFQQIIGAGAAGTGFRPDMSMAEKLAKRAEEPVTQYKAQQASDVAARKEGREIESLDLSKRMKEQQLKFGESKEQRSKFGEERAKAKEGRTAQGFQLDQKEKKQSFEYSKLEAKKLGMEIESDEQLNTMLDQTEGPLVSSMKKDIQNKLNELAKKGEYEAEFLPDTGQSLRELAYLNKYLNENKGGLDEYQSRSINLREESIKLRKEELALREKGEGRRERGFEFKVGETDTQRKEKIVKAFNSDPFVKDTLKALKASEKAEAIIEKGDKMAPSVMGRLLARMAGEVGVMTDKDVAAFRGSQKWTDALQRFFTLGTQGKLTGEDKKQMKIMVREMRNIELQTLPGYADTMSIQYSKASELDRKEIYDMILPKGADVFGAPTETAPSATEIERRDPKTGKTAIFDQNKKFLRWK